MPKNRRAILLLLLIVSGAAGAQDEAPPDWQRFVQPVLEGGGTGIAFFPTGPGGTDELLDPRGFEVRMTPAHEPGEERVFAAGEPFVPPPGLWRVWLQGEERIGPHSRLIRFGSASREGAVGSSFAAVGPGGRVVPPAAEGAGGGELWLLHAADDPGHYEMSRRRPLEEARQGVLMPAGRTLAALWSGGEARWVALSPPFDVVAGRTVAAPLARPAPEAAHLVVFLAKPEPVDRSALAGLVPTMKQGERERAADLTVANAWGVYAVWYGLSAAEPARLAGGNAALYVEPRTLELPAGGVERVEVPLHARPLLDVSLVLPPRVREEPFSLSVRSRPAGDELARVELGRTAGRHRFVDGLVAGPAEVVLETHLGPFRRRVELVAGEEAFLALEPELIELYGEVRRGGEPHPATIAFRTVAGDTVEAVADDAGAYETASLQPLTLVEVRLDGVEQEPWQDFFMPPLATSRELDFDLSDAEIAVRVVDAETGGGIPGAEVGVKGHYQSDAAAEEGGARDRSRAMARSHTADTEGLLRLPPPRPGRLEIHASAPGYRPLDPPRLVDVPDPPQDQEIVVELVPLGETVSLRLTLPDGSPAAGTEVMRFDPARPREDLGSAVAGGDGVVAVPVEPRGGLLLLRHPAAAFGIVEWADLADTEHPAWTFAPAAAPLTLRVVEPGGERPSSGAFLTLFVGGRRLSGHLLRWLAHAPPRADGSGLWSARGLPREPLRVVAWRPERAGEAEAGALDPLAVEVPHPWPATVEVERLP